MSYYPDDDQDQTLQLGAFVASAALGALAMYLLDPERGARRRANAVDTLREVGRDTSRALSDTSRAVSGKVQDLTHRAGAADVFHTTDSDHFGTRPSSARALLPQGLGSLFSRTAHGMESVAHDLRERNWDPKVRNAALWGGGALGLLSLLTRRSPLTVMAGLAGAAMLARGASTTSLPGKVSATFHNLIGKGHASGPVEIEKTIRIDASPEQVYDLWANYENFPRFMHNVVQVRDLGANLSHWTVKGPAGSSFEWDSLLTEQSRPHRLAWRSVPGGEIEQRGEVRLESIQGGTRATVRLSYTPPAGSAGQAIATLLGSNPAAQLEEDLQRLKNLAERGRLPYSARAGSAESKYVH